MAKAELVEADAFSYALVDKDQAAKLRYCAGEIMKNKTSVAVSLMTIGEMLSIAREELANHHKGTFGKWIESECGFSKATAYRYMDAFRTFSGCLTVGQLEDSAMYALAQKGTPEKALKEVLKLADKGTKITQKLAKEIIRKHLEEPVDQDEPRDAEGGKPAPPPAKPVSPPPPPTKEEQLRAERKKARSYAEYLQRSIDDLNRIQRNAALHPELIKLCGQILKGLERW